MADHNVLSEDEVVGLIMANPMPVMFIDTCNFGNIFRDALEGRCDNAVQTLIWLNEAGAANRYHLVQPIQVIDEYYRPGKFVEPEINGLRSSIEHWESMLKTYGKLNPNITNTYIQYFNLCSAEKLYRYFFQLIGDTFDKALIVESSLEAQKWSRQRLHDCMRPAQRGKNSFGDCEICGTSLALMAQLRKAGFVDDAYFVSANIHDYAQNQCLHDDLKDEFQKVRMEYHCTIKSAYGQIWCRNEINYRGVRR